MPLLLYKTELGSSIHQEHVDAFHVQNYQAQFNWWTQQGPYMKVEEYMDYDPFLGRVTEPSNKQKKEG